MSARNRPVKPGDPLTWVEARIIGMVACGGTNPGIAADLGQTLNTVHTTLVRAFRKLGATSRAHAVTAALLRGDILLSYDTGQVGVCSRIACLGRGEHSDECRIAADSADPTTLAPAPAVEVRQLLAGLRTAEHSQHSSVQRAARIMLRTHNLPTAEIAETLTLSERAVCEHLRRVRHAA